MPTVPDHGRQAPQAPAILLASLALTLPWLLTFNFPPSPTFINQAAAWFGWALAIWLLARRGSGGATAAAIRSAGWPLWLLLVVLGIAAAAAPLRSAAPASLAWSSVAMLASAALAIAAGSALAQQRRLAEATAVLFIPLLVAAGLSAVIAVVQIFLSDFSGNMLVAASAFAERASGNIRQPNHLSSLALWGLIGIVWARDARQLHRAVALPLAVGLVVAIVLSGSRTGLVGILILAGWGAIDRSLSSFNRRWLIGMPIVYAIGWWLFKLWAMRSLGSADAVDRIASGGDISGARFAIWSNAIELIRSHPLLGVGFGEFNFAWTLTAFADRPLQFYDHSHNLALQWMVELGIPLSLLLLALFLVAVWRAFRSAVDARPDERVALRCSFMALLLIGGHSMLEYPLWYAYFLLPTAFAFGICLGSPAGRNATAPARPGDATAVALRAAAVVMAVGTAFAVADYRKVVVIFAPPSDATPLAQRIAEGRRSFFFGHHAEYAAATTGSDAAQQLDALRLASHFLLDTRLMLAWAQALAAVGQIEPARHLADRLREFKNPASSAFFDACDAAPAAPPFQCQPARGELGPADFR